MRTKLLLVLVPIFLSIFVINSVLIYKTTYQSTINDLEREAHDIRGLLMATRRIYHKQFIDSGLPINDKTIGFLPAHAMGRISRDFANWSESELSFNNVSDRARNPDNQADELELKAMDFFRANPEEESLFKKVGGDNPFYHYTEPIWIEPYCLKCHGSKEDAPASIAARYTESYDYQVGDLRGVMSIKLPITFAKERAQKAIMHNLAVTLAGYIIMFVAIYLLIMRFGIRPLKTLMQGSQELAKGNYAWRSRITGDDEIAGVARNFDIMAEQIGIRDQEIRTSEKRYRGLAESAADAIIIFDTSEKIIAWNRAAETVFGYSEEEALNQHINILMPKRYQEDHNRKFKENLKAPAESFANGRTITGYSVRKDGSEFPAEVSISAWEGGGNQRYFTAIIRDITKRRKLEDQLRQSQKMEAVGQLAGGIAHDFNNLLQIIGGYSEMAQIKQIEKRPLADELEKVMDATKKSKTLVAQLLAFSRRQVLELKSIDLAEVVQDMSEMIRRIIGEHITVNIETASNLPPIQADKGMVEQILMNLSINARDAMETEGTLTISTEAIYIDEQFVQAHSWITIGNYLLLTVSDTGSGMDDETREHIFEPFYTSKPEGEGTGLGLSTVYGMVKQHNGFIHVYSEIGMGSTFKIYLPTTDQTPQKEESPFIKQSDEGTETILVADDDEGIRKLAQLMLESAGYTVLLAEDGEEAIQLFRNNYKEIGLTILDVVMPGLGGKAAYDQMCDLQPNARVIFASGYSMTAIHTNFVLDAGMQFLQKPYTREDLLRKVRDVIDRKPFHN